MVGHAIIMSLSNNKTQELWQQFMPEKSRIKHAIGSDLYSIQVYDSSLQFMEFDPSTLFTKWAAVEVSEIDDIPEGMEVLSMKAGQYAVFIHTGVGEKAYETFQYIYGEWLPSSSYELDDRPHFEVLGEKYKNNDSQSEEEVWIPIKSRK